MTTLAGFNQVILSLPQILYQSSLSAMKSIAEFNGRILVLGLVNIPVSSTYLPAATMANTNIVGTYYNGVNNDGIGATITAPSNASLPTINGYVSNQGDSILLSNQTIASQNGVYVVTSVGSSGTPWILTRRSDYNTISKILPDIPVFITNGGSINTSWALQQFAVGSIVGTVNLVYYQYSGIGSVSGMLGNQPTLYVNLYEAPCSTITTDSVGNMTINIPSYINFNTSQVLYVVVDRNMDSITAITDIFTRT